MLDIPESAAAYFAPTSADATFALEEPLVGVEDRPDRPGEPPPAKRLGRRGALKLLGVSLGGVAVSGRVLTASAASTPAAVSTGPVTSRLRPLATGTAPASFASSEFAILEKTVDLIIPETETPGAASAGVHWFLDDAARYDTGLRSDLAAGLRRLDERARMAHGHGFVQLPQATQVELLAEIDDRPKAAGAASTDDRRFFALLKARVIDAYYKSEIGQLGELEWVGHEFYDEFPGACTHADPTNHPRPSWPRSRS